MAQTIVTTRPAYQAYQILYIGFIVAPFLAGLDKFTNLLANWEQYLAPWGQAAAATNLKSHVHVVGGDR